MKKILFLTTTQTVGGNGDTLVEAAIEAAKVNGAEIERIDIRNKKVNPCFQCNKCRDTGVCVLKDDFNDILAVMHTCDSILIESPIYYNYPIAQAIVLLDRLYSTYGTPYEIGKKKKIGIVLTCSGSLPEDLNKQMDGVFTLPSINRSITSYRTEVFTGCDEKETCKNLDDYLNRSKELGEWLSL